LFICGKTTYRYRTKILLFNAQLMAVELTIQKAFIEMQMEDTEGKGAALSVAGANRSIRPSHRWESDP
jgi:hypothetical protein